MVKSDRPYLFKTFPQGEIFHFQKIQEDAIIPFEFYPVEAFEQTFIGREEEPPKEVLKLGIITKGLHLYPSVMSRWTRAH